MEAVRSSTSPSEVQAAGQPSRPPVARKGRRARRILSYVLAVVYAIVFAECFIRIFAPVAIFPRYVTAAPFGIRVNEPSRRYWHMSPDVCIEIRTNSKGIRADREIPYEKPPGVKRIVVLGDSFAMGYEVDLKDMFTTRMEEELRTKGINAEVVNLAVSGHGNAEELIMLQEEGLKYQPDLVLVCWHSTDYDDNVRSGLYRLNARKLERAATSYVPGVEIQKKLYRIPVYEWVSNHSQFYSWARETLSGRVIKPLMVVLRQQKSEDASTEESASASSTTSYVTNLTVALLHQIEDVTHQHGAEFLILDVPNSGTVSAFPRDEHTGTFGLPVTSPIPAFAGYTHEQLFHQRSHRHFTPFACSIVGHVLAEASAPVLTAPKSRTADEVRAPR